MAAVPIPNAGFESGNVEWTTTAPWVITNTGSAFQGTWSIEFAAGFTGMTEFTSQDFFPVSPNQSIAATCMVQQGASSAGNAGAGIKLFWYDINQNLIAYTDGNMVASGSGGEWKQSNVTANAPAGTAYVRIGAKGFRSNENHPVWVDSFTWNLDYNRTITLNSPVNGSTYQEGVVIPFTVTLGGTSPPVSSVTYKRGVTTIGTSSEAPYNFNSSSVPVGVHSITAEALLLDGTTITSAANTVTITATPPDTREFKASNSYTNLVLENLSGITANMPPTALVTGIELLCDYSISALIRAKDIGVVSLPAANEQVAFDIVNNGVIEAILLNKEGTDYTTEGSAITATFPIIRSDFTITETGTSEEKKWVVMVSAPYSETIGSSTSLFGVPSIAAADFAERSIGFRFYPSLGAKPAYADSGDACFRFFLNKIRVRVYFDAGSAEYYFASPDKTQVIKGNLVSSCIHTGNLRTEDATGELQLNSELTIMDGTQTYIGGDWTIHAAYPPTDANQIGEVVAQVVGTNVGMRYNSLPSYTAVINNRSRYEFITANFYGDRNLDSVYGVHGLPRAFAFNASFFYTICTQPDPVKDSPRHVAYHHGHLALGYDEGRVDISVVGQPYNFDGALGASSHTIGDKVTGLLPLSGTILGVFGSKSVWGISGTTVDNFTTQVVSPNIGAIEYTICDMGEPVYANAYGIYTLSQTQRYGDYLGNPMSQDVSPWLRPRLVRKYTSDKEVVVAWPVRAKNQYRLAFSDGYVLSMTLNGQSVPTFSFQNYYLYTPSLVEIGTNTTDVAIPDDNDTGITSTIVSAVGTTTTEVEVDISITHTYRGDIKVTLTSPDGQTITLKDFDGDDDADNVTGILPGTFPSAATVVGTWTLRVIDNSFGDTGTLNEWTLSCVTVV